ncbi:MAG: iron-sulfur cluster assembly protein [Calditrichaceae bacterium]
MNNTITQKDIREILEKIQHPEIDASLEDLGMILDHVIDGQIVNVALALPAAKIPQAVEDAIIKSINEPLAKHGLQTNIQFFNMSEENRRKFLALAKANWKGAI